MRESTEHQLLPKPNIRTLKVLKPQQYQRPSELPFSTQGFGIHHVADSKIGLRPQGAADNFGI